MHNTGFNPQMPTQQFHMPQHANHNASDARKNIIVVTAATTVVALLAVNGFFQFFHGSGLTVSTPEVTTIDGTQVSAEDVTMGKE